jgi:two-component system chemotaxis response regulator CheY
MKSKRKPGVVRALVVDDDSATRLLLVAFLSRYTDCRAASNGKEAVEMFRIAAERGSPFHLICMDILMPEMDGQEALRQIRAIEAAKAIPPADGVKVIMTSSVRDMRQVVRSFQGLCDAYLVKPIDTAALLRQMWSLRLI